MISQPPDNTQTQPTQEIQKVLGDNSVKKTWSKALDLLKSLFTKFYLNKKIFFPVTIASAILVVVLIIGLVFGTNKAQIDRSSPQPNPASLNIVEQTPASSLSKIQIELVRLKDQIQTLDVKQSRLSPPVINYEIRF